MTNSFFRSEMEEEPKRDRGTIVVHTDQSMECIDEIHEMEVQRQFRKLDLNQENQ